MEALLDGAVQGPIVALTLVFGAAFVVLIALWAFALAWAKRSSRVAAIGAVVTVILACCLPATGIAAQRWATARIPAEVAALDPYDRWNSASPGTRRATDVQSHLYVALGFASAALPWALGVGLIVFSGRLRLRAAQRPAQ